MIHVIEDPIVKNAVVRILDAAESMVSAYDDNSEDVLVPSVLQPIADASFDLLMSLAGRAAERTETRVDDGAVRMIFFQKPMFMGLVEGLGREPGSANGFHARLLGDDEINPALVKLIHTARTGVEEGKPNSELDLTPELVQGLILAGYDLLMGLFRRGAQRTSTVIDDFAVRMFASQRDVLVGMVTPLLAA